MFRVVQCVALTLLDSLVSTSQRFRGRPSETVDMNFFLEVNRFFGFLKALFPEILNDLYWDPGKLQI